MEHHEGKIFKRLIEENTTQITVARKLKKDKNTIANWCAKERLPVETWLAFGKAFRINVRDEVPRLAEFDETKVLMIYSEDAQEYINDLTKIQTMLEERNQKVADYKVVVESLEQRVKDLEDIISTKNDLVESLKNELRNSKGG